MSTTASLTRRLAPFALMAALGLGLGACSHTAGGGDFAKPVASASGSPIDPGPAAAPAPATADANPVNVGTINAASDAPAAPVRTKKPAVPAKVAKAAPAAPEPSVAPAAFAAEPQPLPGEPEKVPAPVVKTVRDDGFPNINAPPPEPTGKLLTPEERARVISELEALKNRQGVAPQKAPAKKCTADQIAAGVAGCPAPTN
ncbi:MAG: hypothetical protein J0H94_10885 [Rhizobiales bacterium]|nr:hypothetical protein [Hyphomicrobiales bacterium]